MPKRNIDQLEHERKIGLAEIKTRPLAKRSRRDGDSDDVGRGEETKNESSGPSKEPTTRRNVAADYTHRRDDADAPQNAYDAEKENEDHNLDRELKEGLAQIKPRNAPSKKQRRKETPEEVAKKKVEQDEIAKRKRKDGPDLDRKLKEGLAQIKPCQAPSKERRTEKSEEEAAKKKQEQVEVAKRKREDDRERKEGLAQMKPSKAPSKTQHRKETPEEAAKKKRKQDEIAKRKQMEADEAKVKRAWQKSLKPWKRPTNTSDYFFWPIGTWCMTKHDAKSKYGLTDKEMKSLAYEDLLQPKEKMYSVPDIVNLAMRKFHAGMYEENIVDETGEPLDDQGEFKEYRKRTNQLEFRLGAWSSL